MWIRDVFNRQFLMRNITQGVAFLFGIVLISGCGSEETVDKPMVETVGDKSFEPASPNYFPLTVGNRWVYRNADGSDWTRKVTETEEVGSRLYHSFSYNPLIDEDQSDIAETPRYTPTPYVETPDRLLYESTLRDINDAVQHTISQSGQVPPARWVIGVRCRTEGERAVAVCRMSKRENIVRDGRELQEINNDALMLLHQYDARVVWTSDLTLLRFPLDPYRRRKALDIRLSGIWDWPVHWDWEGVGMTHSFEANVTISGIAGEPESVVTPAGTFANCLKIRYEMTRMSFETTKFTEAWPVFEERKLELSEKEFHKELTALFRDGLTRLQLGAVWLAPDVGPVKIERANGISELISYDVKTDRDLRQLASHP